MVPWSARSFLLLLSLSAAGPAAGAEFLPLLLPGVEVYYRAGDARLARQAGLAVQRAGEEIHARLGVRPTPPVRVFVVRGDAEFRRTAGEGAPEWALAVALPEGRRVVVNAALVAEATADDMRLVIAHEIVHLALASVENAKAGPLPRWFHEGVAVWLSGSAPLRGDRSAFRVAAAQGALLPFDDLERGFPAHPREADLAYLQSEAFVGHLIAAHSSDAIARLLDRYRGGEPFDRAFAAVFGAGRASIEADWKKSLRRRFPWLRITWELTTLFGVLALGTIVAFFIVRRRAQRQKDEWDEEDQMWTVVAHGDDDTIEEEEEEEDDEPWL